MQVSRKIRRRVGSDDRFKLVVETRERERVAKEEGRVMEYSKEKV